MRRSLLASMWCCERLPDLSPREWESLLAQARRCRLAGRLACLLVDRQWLHLAPPRAQTALRNALREVERKHDEVVWEVDRIRAALAGVTSPVVLLKGAAYVMTGLPPARGRLFSDIDIMVSRAQLKATESALFASGWIAQKLDPYDERYYRDWMHELPPLQHVNRQSLLDVHHTITPPTSRFAVDARRLLERLRPIAGHDGLFTLNPVDMVLHGAVHLMQDGDLTGSLRDVMDFDDLVRAFDRDPSFWPDLVQRADELGLMSALVDVWTQARHRFGTPAPDDLHTARLLMQSRSPTRQLMARLLNVALRPDHPDCDSWLTPMARQALYVRSHALRMPWFQIAPHLIRKAWKRSRTRYGQVLRIRPKAQIEI